MDTQKITIRVKPLFIIDLYWFYVTYIYKKKNILIVNIIFMKMVDKCQYRIKKKKLYRLLYIFPRKKY